MDRLKLSLALVMGLLLSLAVACGSDDETPEQTADTTLATAPATAQFPYTVTGSDGQDIVFEAPPERIVAMDSAVVEILYAIGEGARVVGTHDFVAHPPDSKDIPKLGGAYEMNIEATVALEPDLVFIFSDGLLEDLRRVGLKVFYQKSLESDFTTIAENISVWGRITGAVEAAERLASEFEDRVAALETKLAGLEAGPTVFQNEGNLWTPGPDTLVNEVFEVLKLQNIAHDISGYAQLSPEVIVERDPEVIIASYGDDISDNPAFKNVTAVASQRVYVPESDALSIPGPRYVEGIEKLAEWVYPELFQ